MSGGRLSRHLLTCLVAVAVAVAGCGDDGPVEAGGGAGDTVVDWDQLDEIAYLLPDELPAGWAVRLATERPGRPREQWTERIEVLGDRSGQSYLVLWASVSPGAGSVRGEPVVVEDVPVDAFTFLYAYVIGSEPPAGARGAIWQDGDVELAVAMLAAAPDDDLIEQVADELAGRGGGGFHRLDHPLPDAALDAGFTPAGVASSPQDVTDYTVTWAPADLVGTDRAAASATPDEGPAVAINVGARFYAQAQDDLAPGAASATVTTDGDVLSIRFLISGSPVTVSGREVSEEDLRAFAASLQAHDRDDWRDRLGERLLVDTPQP